MVVIIIMVVKVAVMVMMVVVTVMMDGLVNPTSTVKCDERTRVNERRDY